MVMKAGDLVSLSFGQLMVSHGVPLCFFGEKKRTRTGSWPLLSYAPWVLQLLSEFASLFQRANITFSGAPDSDNPDYLSVQSETENLAIEIYDGKGQQIHLGEPSPDYALNPGKNTLNFTAYLISRDGRMTSGEFTAVTHFVVNYL
ncbi:fimbrial protein [Citrobacter freundii]|uniref:fimbrial protein n=2 Tax=Citrobacter freundii TaxID=546 RepID=UPI001E33469B|nr:fimbrial protein [Citrobacter freundii]